MKGELIKSKKNDLPDYTARKHSGYQNDDRKTEVEHIGKLKNGNYYFHCVNQMMRIEGGGGGIPDAHPGAIGSGTSNAGSFICNYYAPICYSYYEINKDLEKVNSKTVQLDEDFLYKSSASYSSDQCRYFNSSEDGNTVFYEVDFKNQRSLKLINFSEQGEIKEKQFFSYPFKPSKERRYQDFFIMDNKLITLQDLGDAGMELKVY